MKIRNLIQFALVITTLLISKPALSDRQDDYDQCILHNLQDVKYDWVSKEIRRICKENYLNRIPPSNRRQQYNQCILNFLPSVECEDAANAIIKSCKSQFLD